MGVPPGGAAGVGPLVTVPGETAIGFCWLSPNADVAIVKQMKQQNQNRFLAPCIDHTPETAFVTTPLRTSKFCASARGLINSLDLNSEGPPQLAVFLYAFMLRCVRQVMAQSGHANRRDPRQLSGATDIAI